MPFYSYYFLETIHLSKILIDDIIVAPSQLEIDL